MAENQEPMEEEDSTTDSDGTEMEETEEQEVDTNRDGYIDLAAQFMTELNQSVDGQTKLAILLSWQKENPDKDQEVPDKKSEDFDKPSTSRGHQSSSDTQKRFVEKWSKIFSDKEKATLADYLLCQMKKKVAPRQPPPPPPKGYRIKCRLGTCRDLNEAPIFNIESEFRVHKNYQHDNLVNQFNAERPVADRNRRHERGLIRNRSVIVDAKASYEAPNEAHRNNQPHSSLVRTDSISSYELRITLGLGRSVKEEDEEPKEDVTQKEDDEGEEEERENREKDN